MAARWLFGPACLVAFVFLQAWFLSAFLPFYSLCHSPIFLSVVYSVLGLGGASKRTHWEGHIRWRAFWLCCRLGFYPPRRRCKQFHLYTAKLQTCVLPAVLMTNDTAGTSLSEVGRWNVEFVPKVKPHVLTCFTRWHGGARGWVGWTDNRLLW